MRYSASEKLEIIRLVEQSHLPVRRTLGQIGIPRSTFYRWYDQYQTGGPEALDDRSPRPDRVWNRIPDDVGFGIGIAHGYATLGSIGFEGRFDDAAIGTVSNVASRLCDEAKPGQVLISTPCPRGSRRSCHR